MDAPFSARGWSGEKTIDPRFKPPPLVPPPEFNCTLRNLECFCSLTSSTNSKSPSYLAFFFALAKVVTDSKRTTTQIFHELHIVKPFILTVLVGRIYPIKITCCLHKKIPRHYRLALATLIALLRFSVLGFDSDPNRVAV